MATENNTQTNARRPIRLKDVKWGELGQVPIFELLGAFDRILMMMLAAVFIGVGTDSVAVGFGTLFALRFIASKVDQAASDRQ
jgi:hypothetical protein